MKKFYYKYIKIKKKKKKKKIFKKRYQIEKRILKINFNTK